MCTHLHEEFGHPLLAEHLSLLSALALRLLQHCLRLRGRSLVVIVYRVRHGQPELLALPVALVLERHCVLLQTGLADFRRRIEEEGLLLRLQKSFIH